MIEEVKTFNPFRSQRRFSMDDSQNRTRRRAIRVREFNAQRIDDFSEAGVARRRVS
jgi:hypothetical protein